MSDYFNKIPNFQYVSRLPNAKISDYITVKNLFKRGKLREDIFENLMYFTKYTIKGDDRPDNVAEKEYEDPTLDWIILICNNIMNIQDEWPMSNYDFDKYLLDKYDNYETLNEVHHYETVEIKNDDGIILLKKGFTVNSNFSFTYYDEYLETTQTIASPIVPITNYQFEEKIQTSKREIFILRPDYLNIVEDDMDEIMTYKKGTTQYVSEALKRADNIRLYT